MDEFLDRMINDRKISVKIDYEGQTHKQDILRGSVEGLEACRGRTLGQIQTMLENAHRQMVRAMSMNAVNYWRLRAKELEIKWVLGIAKSYNPLTNNDLQ